jgi:tetratricopeptide (TPR) repeat protein
MLSAMVAVLALVLAPEAEAAGVRIAGEVTDLDGKPIDGATVEIISEKLTRTWKATSKKDGKWAAIIESNEWKFVVSADGFQTFEETRTLETLGRKPTLNFRLAPEGAKVVAVDPSAAAPEATPQPQIDLEDLKAGNALYDQGQFKEAISAYQAALVKNPTIDKINISIADSYVKLSDYATAAEYYAKVPETDELAERAWIGLADAHMRLKKTDEAVAVYKKVLAKNPQNPDANYILGQIIFNEKNDAQGALSYLEAAAAAKPDWAAVQLKLGYVYVNLGDNAKAKAAFQKALELEPGNAEAKSMLEMF